jgi:sulfur carrier protein
VSTVACTVNGEACDLAPDTTVAGLVDRWCPSPRGVAVAVNGEVVPKSTWDDTTVAVGDEVEIVSAAAGG